LVVINTNHAASYLENQVQVSVYMKDDVGFAGLEKTEKELLALPGVTGVNFVSKDKALIKFKERLGDQQSLLDSIGKDNPFPNYFEVRVKDADTIDKISDVIDKMEGVDTAKFGRKIIERVFQITSLFRIAGIVLIILLGFATLFIISNTIRITVFARRKEVNIMKFVGATDWFIRWPFLLEGMFLGLVGAIVADVIITQGYILLTDYISDVLAFFPLVSSWPMLLFVNIGLIIVGTSIGALGSFISLRKYLKV
jgi:cell division transport system permease protein